MVEKRLFVYRLAALSVLFTFGLGFLGGLFADWIIGLSYVFGFVSTLVAFVAVIYDAAKAF